MLSEDDIARFRAFGYAVVKSCVHASQMETLRSTFDRVMETAERLDELGTEGTRFYSFGEDADPAIAAMVFHEPILRSVRDLLGAQPLYVGSFLMLNRDDQPWHTTGMPGEGPDTVRVILYLDKSREEQGALHVLPGSHLLEYGRTLFRELGHWDGRGTRLRGDPRSFPGAVALSTDPGDVLIWYTRMWHASFKRADTKPRRGIYLSYLADPGDDPIACEKLRRIAQGSRSPARPYLYGEHLAALREPNLGAMVARLKELGVPNVIKE